MVCRSAFGAAAPLLTQYMFESLGVGGGGSLIRGVAVLLAFIPFVFYKYGGPIRERSKFAPTPAKEDIQAGREEEHSSERTTVESDEITDEGEQENEKGKLEAGVLEGDGREGRQNGSGKDLEKGE